MLSIGPCWSDPLTPSSHLICIRELRFCLQPHLERRRCGCCCSRCTAPRGSSRAPRSSRCPWPLPRGGVWRLGGPMPALRHPGRAPPCAPSSTASSYCPALRRPGESPALHTRFYGFLLLSMLLLVVDVVAHLQGGQELRRRRGLHLPPPWAQALRPPQPAPPADTGASSAGAAGRGEAEPAGEVDGGKAVAAGAVGGCRSMRRTREVGPHACREKMASCLRSGKEVSGGGRYRV